jgi:hypothetical protein
MPPKHRTTPRDVKSASPRYREEEFQTWEAFKNGIRGVLPCSRDYDIYKNYIFRGQGGDMWPLRSTFDRIYSDKQAASRDTLVRCLPQCG